MSGHQKFTGPVIELRSTWGRDDRLATGQSEPPRLQIGREELSNQIMIQVDDSHQFTMTNEMRDRLIHLMAGL